MEINKYSANSVCKCSDAVVDALNTLLLHNTMSASMKTSITTAMNSLVDVNLTTRHQKRVRAAIYLIATSSQYDIQR